MDTQYSNILNALQPSKLTPAQQAENYKAFDEIQKQGVSLPELLKKIGEMETRLKTIESVKAPDMSSEVFSAMEVAVKGDPEVKLAKQRASDVKSRIISEMCLKDERYRKAIEDYRATVSKAYVAKNEEVKGKETMEEA